MVSALVGRFSVGSKKILASAGNRWPGKGIGSLIFLGILTFVLSDDLIKKVK